MSWYVLGICVIVVVSKYMDAQLYISKATGMAYTI